MSNAAQITSVENFLSHHDLFAFWNGRPNGDAPASDYDPAAVIDAHQKQASRCCGCYFELYEAILLRGLRNELDKLEGADKFAFQQALWVRRIKIDDETIAEDEQAESECMDEERRDQE